eukprot:8305759-Alexandrium_andersonii.AAC.1
MGLRWWTAIATEIHGQCPFNSQLPVLTASLLAVCSSDELCWAVAALWIPKSGREPLNSGLAKSGTASDQRVEG